MSNSLLPVEIIKKTKNKIPLSESEMLSFINNYTQGLIPDYQVSAWLMAVVLQGLTTDETYALTKSMLHSGQTMDLKSISQPKVDKHSTGGIGDKTSIILGPIVAACGVTVPMMSGRGLGHTGGTLDKLESIPGFNTQLDIHTFIHILKKHGICFIGQTKNICPADKKLYALRDVTGTVESLPLISASIMSKKLAEDLDALVLDVKFGSGAFMKSFAEAKSLALSLQNIGKKDGKKVTALLTNMNQPLGAFIGNSLEIQECLDILSGKTLLNKHGHDLYADTRELSIILSSHMIHLAGITSTVKEAYEKAKQTLHSGVALKVFEDVCHSQGGNLSKLPSAQHSFTIKSKKTGYINHFDGEKIGILGIKLGAGRSLVTDTINPIAGFQIHFKVGESIEIGDVLWTVYCSEKSQFDSIEQDLLNAVEISDFLPNTLELIKEIIDSL